VVWINAALLDSSAAAVHASASEATTTTAVHAGISVLRAVPVCREDAHAQERFAASILLPAPPQVESAPAQQQQKDQVSVLTVA
jgi:hypothetical protein